MDGKITLNQLNYIRTRAIPTKTGQVISYADGDDGDLQNGYDRGTRFESISIQSGQMIIVDHHTGLMWALHTAVFSPFGFLTDYWPEAVAAPIGQTLWGWNDWYLPNAKELMSVCDYNDPMESGIGLFAGGVGINQCWSSTTTPNNTGAALFLDIASGSLTSMPKTFQPKYAVFCRKFK